MLPQEVVTLAARSPAQLVTLTELRGLGYESHAVARWLRRGLLDRALPGVYRLGGAMPAADENLHLPLRYLARFGDPAATPLISGEAMLALAGVEGYGVPAQPVVLVDPKHRVRLAGAPFAPRHVAVAAVPRQRHRGVDTSDPAQALADMAWDPSVTDRQLRVAVDAVRFHLRAPITGLVARWRQIGHPGARRLLAMLAAFEQESEGERQAFNDLFLGYPPLPDCQVVLAGRLRVDFVYLDAALVIEYLGECHDGRADKDTARVFVIERPGYRHIPVTKSLLRPSDGIREHIQAERHHRRQLIAEGRLRLPALPPQPPRLFPLRTLPRG